MELVNITAAHWQPALGRFGEVVTDIDDIEQCIHIILKTPKGTDLHRPEFGSDLWRYIDQPLPQVIPHVISETIDAIRLWEPRASIVSVEPRIEDHGHLVIRLRWQPTEDASKTFETSIYFGGRA